MSREGEEGGNYEGGVEQKGREGSFKKKGVKWGKAEGENFKIQIEFCLLLLGSSSEVPSWSNLFMNGAASNWR